MINPYRTDALLPQPGMLVGRRTLIQASMFGAASWAALQGTAGKKVTASETLSGEIGFGRAKRCLLLFMWGGPSQLDTFDPKPEAPDAVRGPFKTIATNVPGINFSENFQLLSQRADKLAVIRSLGHDDPAHLSSGHTTLTGQLPPRNKSDAAPPSDRDTPHIGCVMSKLRPSLGALPSFVTVPWFAYHPAAPGGQAPGQDSGWLGRQYDPLLAAGDPNAPGWQVPSLSLIEGQSPDRLLRRQNLLTLMDTQRRLVDEASMSRRLNAQQQQAFGLLTSSSVRQAFDLEQESPETRDRYGRNTHGQSVLLARRLLDHGVPFVSVNWQNDGQNFWDTHGNNFNRLKNDLIPPSDRAFSAVLDDLEQSGQLNDTLVVWVGEFGRSPHINASVGREHHPYCYCGVMAGGGIRGGQVYGASDKHGAYPSDKPLTPHDLVATMYHALGVAPGEVLHDGLNRPHQIVAGRPVRELFV
ncbi:DUF1501 domain-containing protein [Schlesneria sp. T3-172]|uniref:DUF1501 domain-containing protein n=1 Tax=Schlesneria sphaerica TaxID=3373610 RepID=UPI0037C6E3D0